MEIYKHLSILKKFHLTIESAFAYDDYFLLGTKEGYLLKYKLDLVFSEPNEYNAKVTLLCLAKQFSKKPIVQLQAIPEHRILLSLSDNIVSVHSLDQYQFGLICNLSKTKGATHFAVDVNRAETLTGEVQYTIRLCVVVKNYLLFYYWKNNDFHELRSSIKLNDVARVVVWSSNLLYVGLRNQFVKVSVDQGSFKDMFNTAAEPIIIPLASNDSLALCRDKDTYILDRDGKPLLEYAIHWDDAPIALAEDSLFLLSIQVDGTLQVLAFNTKDVVYLQKSNLFNQINRKPKGLLKCRNRNGQLILFSENDLILLKAVSFDQQRRLLMEADHFDLAYKIVDLDKEVSDVKESETIKSTIQNMHALQLFTQGKYGEAIEKLQSLDTDPTYVIGLFDCLLPDEFRARLNYPLKLPHIEGAELEKGLWALTDYLLEERRALSKKLQNGKYRSSSSDIVKLQSIIDTSLLKCYLHTNNALVEHLLRIPDNHCNLEESEKALKKCLKYKELIVLYKTKNMHREALDLLQRLARYDGNPTQSRQHLILYLQDLGAKNIDLIFEYSEWILREYADEGLRIFIDDLVIEHEFPLPREQVLSYLERINPSVVIKYLEHIIFEWNDKTTYFHDTLINKYRERIRSLMAIYQLEKHQQKEANTIEILEDETLDGSRSMNSSLISRTSSISREYVLRPEPAGQEPGELGNLRRKLMRLLEESECYSTETLPTYLLHDGLFHERAIVMGKIGNHREALIIYVHILNDLQRAEEYCLNQYKKPESINKTSKHGTSNKEVFFLFFEQCLMEPRQSMESDTVESMLSLIPRSWVATDFDDKNIEQLQPKVRTALAILARHSTRIDLLRCIDMLPSSLQLVALKSILISSMRHLTSHKNSVQILRQLLHAQRLRTQLARINIEKSNQILITNIDVCQSCFKKIGKSVFVRYINGDLVHLGCRDNYEHSDK